MRRLICEGDGTLDIVDETHYEYFTELSVPHSGTHGVAKRSLGHGEDIFRQNSLAVERIIDRHIVYVVDGL